MKIKLFTPIMFLFVLLNGWSEISPIEKDSTQSRLTTTAVAGLNISQLALSNWTQGGDNSLTWTFTLNGGIKYYKEQWTFVNNLKAAYGRTKLGLQDFRTNDNELYIESIISRILNWAVDPYFSNSIRTGLTSGYSYSTDPPVKTSDFFDPGYITQSLGFGYNKIPGFNTRLGIAIQEVFTNIYTKFSDNPSTDKIEKFKLETGVESVTSAEYNLIDNLYLKSSLRLFSRFESLNVWDVRWDNVITAKINNYLNVNLSYLLVYQKDQSPKTQMKEALQLGFVYTIL